MERSRSPKDIIEEVRSLAEQGYKEITLLGQNVNSYLRVEREKNIEFEEYEGINSFATLLRAVNKIEGIERIRFVSPHPKDFTDDVIEAIRDCEKVCKIIHLPLQSGSTNVLKVMNRKYTKEQYLSLVEKIKELVENQIKENNDKYVGTMQRLLVEGVSKNNEEMLTGRTDTNKVVVFEGSKDLIGNMVNVEIVSEHMWYLKGQIK